MTDVIHDGNIQGNLLKIFKNIFFKHSNLRKVNCVAYFVVLSGIMISTELKMQPTIHLERNAGYGRGKYPAVPCKWIAKWIVACIFNSVWFIITCESPYIDIQIDFTFEIYIICSFKNRLLVFILKID
jgi:hypothetical protein